MASTTLSEQIYSELYHDITDQRLRCGEKLTLKMLKDRFNVSHTPIREALMRLAENGLVTYYSNCGVTVTEFTPNDIRELYQFASELDAMAIQFCANSFNPMPLLMDLQEIIELGNEMLTQGDLRGWKESSENFHVAFYNHAQNNYLNVADAQLRAKLEVLSCMYYKEQNVKKIHAEHIAIYEQVKNGHFTEAAALMRQHLQYDMAYALKAYAEYQQTDK